MAHTRPGKRRDGPPGLPGGSICPFESSLGVAWQTVYQKFSHSTTLTPPIVLTLVPPAACRRPRPETGHGCDGLGELCARHQPRKATADRKRHSAAPKPINAAQKLAFSFSRTCNHFCNLRSPMQTCICPFRLAFSFADGKSFAKRVAR